MKLSIAICTHNEKEYIGALLKRLTDFIKGPGQMTGHEYEIVVLGDRLDDEMYFQLGVFRSLFTPLISLEFHDLNGDFATHKNYMNSKCTGDFILNLDADEWLPDDVLFNIPAIIESNPAVEAYWLPRINTVTGLTQKHVTKWFWTISRLEGMRVATNPESLSEAELELLRGHSLIISSDQDMIIYDKPIVCWPDPQMRLYKNSPDIKWVNKVHEKLTGFKNFSSFPYDPDYAIRHEKDIKRQEAQNSFYETIT